MHFIHTNVLQAVIDSLPLMMFICDAHEFYLNLIDSELRTQNSDIHLFDQ